MRRRHAEIRKRSTLLIVLAVIGAIAAAGAAETRTTPNRTERQVPLIPADRIPPAPVLTPDQALAAFTVAPGVKVEIAASEPQIEAPVAITFGEDGRLWVVEMRGYMAELDGRGEEQRSGRVVVLSDHDGDGRYETAQTFLDKLILPRAIALVGNGVLVGTPPELAFWEDTDGDGVADRKQVLATDYGVEIDPRRMYLANPERAPNSLLRSFDNWYYSSSYTRKFRYRNGTWESGPTIFRGQWGLSHDDRGRLHYNSNSDQLRVDVVHSDYLQRNSHYPRLSGTNVNAAEDQFVWPVRVTPGINRGYLPEMLRDGRLKEFTAACAPWVYRGDLLPEFYGDVFVAEPSANLVRRNIVTETGGVPRARNAYSRAEFLASTDERFRPVNFTTGPDGALYIVDMYRGVIQHRIQLTPYLSEQSRDRNLIAPRNLGRIYRIVPSDRPPRRMTRIPPQPSSEWMSHLFHSNAWWRETAQRMLVDSDAREHIPALRRLAGSNAIPPGRVHALWTLDGLAGLDRETLRTALADKSALVRETAARLAGRRSLLAEETALRTRLRELTTDADPSVQLQAALTLGNVGDDETARLLADLALHHPHRPFLRSALYSGVAGRELSLLESLISDPTWKPDHAAGNTILAGLAEGVAASRGPEAIERILSLAARSAGTAPARTRSLLQGAMAGFGASNRPVNFKQQPAGWTVLAAHDEFAAERRKLGEILRWPGAQTAAAAQRRDPLGPEDQRLFEVGRPIFTAICAPCHQAHGGGLEGLAPPLVDSEWVLGPPARLVRIILHGLRGQIVVAGRTYTGDMPAFGSLEDEQVAAILTYVRNEWGQSAHAISPAEVAAIRVSTKDRADAWSSRELTQLR